MYLKRLAYFVAASQQQGLAGAASELKITQSTLSAALKTLAEEVGTPLFEHVHRRLHPSRAGLWLFRSALPILHAEEFARNWIAAGEPDKELVHLVVDVKLSFALGRVSKAVGCAIQAFSRTHPHVFVEPRFADMHDGESVARLPVPTMGSLSALVIDAHALEHDERSPGLEQMELRRDPWVIVRNLAASESEGSGLPIIVPALGESLLRQLSGITGTGGSRKLHLADEPAGALPRMLFEHANATFLMPRSMAADRVGLQNISIQPFLPEAYSHIVARFRKGDDAAKGLAGLIRGELACEERNLIFRPTISLRQMRYHRTLCEMGSVTSAARQLFVAQPALTAQLGKLERTIGDKLFIRSRKGLQATSAAVRLRQAGSFVQDRVRRIDVESVKFFDGEGGLLRLGVIPSAGPGSLLLHGLAEAIEAWRAAYPTMRLQILEAQTDTLHSMVKAGAVNFAVVERSIPEVARVELAGAEPLALIFDPSAAGLEKTVVKFEDIMRLPLVLPTRQSGLRQIIDEAAIKVGIKLSPQFEVNAMPLLLQLLRGREIYTIMPESAVKRDVGVRALKTALIVDGDVDRQFYAIHSAERSLTRPERDFIAILRTELGESRGQWQAVGYAANPVATSAFNPINRS